MKTCLVSLISDQTIPNILVTSEIMPDHLLLISTESMEKKNKSDAILTCMYILGIDYKERNDRIIVPENSIPDFYEKVMEWIKTKRKEFKFIVNLTGGTKLMSLAAYETFNSYGAEMVYMPIPENKYFPVHRPNEIVPIPKRLSVEAYLAAYNVSLKNLKKMEVIKKEAHERKDITSFIFKHYKQLQPLMQRAGSILRDQRVNDIKKRGLDFSIDYSIKSPVERTLLDKMDFEYVGNHIKKKIDFSTWNYLRGGWLEERLFMAFESVLPESSDICLNVVCEVNGNRNEYDVLATYENILYVVECKSLQAREGSEMDMGGTINDFLYKLGALRQTFGLTPKCLLATTTEKILENGKIKQHLIERGKLFNSQIMPLWQIKDLEGWLKENIFKK